MSVTIQTDTTQLNRLIRNLESIDKGFNKSSLRKIFVKAARPVVAAVKAKVPVDTGALKKSIGIIPWLGVRTGAVFIGVKKDKVKKKTTTWYGKFLEFGTKYIPKGKFTFFEPAVNQSIEQSKTIIYNELKSILSRHGR